METKEIKYFTFSALLSISERAKKRKFSNKIKPEVLINHFDAEALYPIMYDFYHEDVFGGFFRCAITDGATKYLIDVDLKDYNQYRNIAKIPREDIEKTINQNIKKT